MTPSGLDRMRAIRDGEAPPAPIQATLGFELTEVDEGRVVFAGEPGERHFNPMGTVHGGFALTLLDSACGACVHTTLSADEAYATLEIKVNLVRALTAETGPVRAEGTVIHRGGRVATSEGRLVGERDGKLYAHATSTCMIFAAAGLR
jgi:uncharacterized protein (TIGR00369 family)